MDIELKSVQENMSSSNATINTSADKEYVTEIKRRNKWQIMCQCRAIMFYHQEGRSYITNCSTRKCIYYIKHLCKRRSRHGGCGYPLRVFNSHQDPKTIMDLKGAIYELSEKVIPNLHQYYITIYIKVTKGL